MKKGRTVRSANGTMFFLNVVAVCVVPVSLIAQSGRSPKQPAPPTVADKPAKKPTASSPPAAAKLVVHVTDHVPSSNFTVATGWAYRSFVDRLRESPNVVTTADGEMRRKDAIDAAKRQTDGYVAWLHLEIDPGPLDFEKDPEVAAISPINLSCLYISYEVYEAGTGRTIAGGHVYQPGQPSRCLGGVYHPSPYPDDPQRMRRPPEYTIRRAADEAADRVMTALHIPLPPKHA